MIAVLWPCVTLALGIGFLCVAGMWVGTKKEAVEVLHALKLNFSRAEESLAAAEKKVTLLEAAMTEMALKFREDIEVLKRRTAK